MQYWRREERQVLAEAARVRAEVLWINPVAAEHCGRERLKKVDEERNRMFERLKDITSTLGGVTFTDGRQWGAYNALCDIVKDIGGELSK